AVFGDGVDGGDGPAVDLSDRDNGVGAAIGRHRDLRDAFAQARDLARAAVDAIEIDLDFSWWPTTLFASRSGCSGGFAGALACQALGGDGFFFAIDATIGEVLVFARQGYGINLQQSLLHRSASVAALAGTGEKEQAAAVGRPHGRGLGE